MFDSDISTSGIGSRPSVLSAISTSSPSRSAVHSRGDGESYLKSNASADSQVGSNHVYASSGGDPSKPSSDHGQQPAHAVPSTNSPDIKQGDPEQFLNDQIEKRVARNNRFQKVIDEMDVASNSKGGVRGTPPREFQGWIGVASIEASLPDVPGVPVARPAAESEVSAPKKGQTLEAQKLDVLV